MIVEAINSIAQGMGYAVLTLFGIILAVGMLPSPDLDSSEPAVLEETNTVNDIIQERLTLSEEADRIEPTNQPAMQWDWSFNCDITEPELLEMRAAIQEAGFVVHPFPSSPHHSIGSKKWEWDDGHVGVWVDEPSFELVTESDRRIDVTPDLSGWHLTVDQEADDV